jgi:hypothetical protein
MLRYQDVKTKKSRFLALTGFKIEEFEQFLTYFEEAFDFYMEHFTIDGKKREYRSYSTYANSPLPTMADKLLFILVYLKHNMHQEVQGSLFGMSQTNVSKWVHLLHSIVNIALERQNYLPARTAEEFAVYLQNRIQPHDDSPRFGGGNNDGGSPNESQDTTTSVSITSETEMIPDVQQIFFHDGTERPIHRPLDPFDQEDYYSGKKKNHMLKNIIISDHVGFIPFLSTTYAGSAHDKRVTDEAAYVFPNGSMVYQDTGFQGFAPEGVTIMQPKKKPKGKELTPDEKAENRRISAVRIFIEHVIGSVKRYRIIKDEIRLWKGNIRDKVLETCSGLHNFRITSRPLCCTRNKS